MFPCGQALEGLRRRRGKQYPEAPSRMSCGCIQFERDQGGKMLDAPRARWLLSHVSPV